MWRGGLGWAYLLADPFGYRCLNSHTVLRFRIRLPDKDSRFRPQQVASQQRQLHQSQRLVEVGVRVARPTRTVYLVLTTQPPAKPLTHVCINGSIGFTDRTQVKVVRPTTQLEVEFSDLLMGILPQPAS